MTDAVEQALRAFDEFVGARDTGDPMSCPADPNGITSHQWVCYDETASGRWFVCRNCGAEEWEPANQTPPTT